MIKALLTYKVEWIREFAKRLDKKYQLLYYDAEMLLFKDHEIRFRVLGPQDWQRIKVWELNIYRLSKVENYQTAQLGDLIEKIINA